VSNKKLQSLKPRELSRKMEIEIAKREPTKAWTANCLTMNYGC